jgi:hypothetical protein
VQLSNHIPSFQHYISSVISKNEKIASQSLSDQWRQLIHRPLLKLDGHNSQLYYILIIDALNECDNEDHIRTILQLLAKARLLTRVQLRVFLTSRPEIPIRHGICTLPQGEHQDFVLHNIHPSIVDYDISLMRLFKVNAPDFRVG